MCVFVGECVCVSVYVSACVWVDARACVYAILAAFQQVHFSNVRHTTKNEGHGVCNILLVLARSVAQEALQRGLATTLQINTHTYICNKLVLEYVCVCVYSYAVYVRHTHVWHSYVCMRTEFIHTFRIHMYVPHTMYVRYHLLYSHVQCACKVLANPSCVMWVRCRVE